ncbi:MAG: hypothetical protein OXC61_03745 [Flavobacteriaceae bacterium]|nr:hypothetical protein [Flavobacteriaceae bacterium]
MFEFSQYLGFIVFTGIVLMGFWLMIFLATFLVPYWIFGPMIEKIKAFIKSKKSPLKP